GCGATSRRSLSFRATYQGDPSRPPRCVAAAAGDLSSRAPCSLGGALLHLGDVGVHDRAVLGGGPLAERLHDLLALLLGQLAPHVRDLLDPLLVDVAGAAGRAALGVLLRAGRLRRVARRAALAGLAAGRAVAVVVAAAALLLLLLVLELLDHL